MRILVTGTDTGIGKTVFSAGLTRFLDGWYWKPIQAGTEGGTDSATVRQLSGMPPERILPEAWVLATPASPHLAAERDGVAIDAERLSLPRVDGPLIIEAAGGLLVPVTRRTLQIELMARWNAPVVLCARTALGTLNHTFLSLEALRSRGIAVLGVALIGDEHADNARTLAEMGGVRVLGRLPRLEPLTTQALAAAFEAGFRREHFLD